MISAVCKYYRIPKEDLFASKRGTENIPRDAAIYLVRRLCKMTLPKVGEKFGIENYSSVSSAIQRMKLRVETDRLLRKKLNEIEMIAVKGQGQT